MDFFIVVVGLILFFYLNYRVNQLEEKVKKGSTSMPASSPIKTPAQTPSQPQPQHQSAEIKQPASAPSVSGPSVHQPSGEEVGGQWLGKIGIVAIFIGVAFFLKYAFDNNLIGVVGRVIIGILAGIILNLLGQYLRRKYALYSDLLIGGGMGIFYLTVFSAFDFYHLITLPTTFVCIAIVTIVAGISSLVNNSLAIALIGVLGGFFTPFMISFGADNGVSLFAYLLFINVGVMVLALIKRWPQLVYTAFVATTIVFIAWYNSYYTPYRLTMVMFYLTTYFIMFLLSTVVRNLIRRERASEGAAVWITINGLLYYLAGYLLINPQYPGMMSYFAIALAALYLIIACVCYFVLPDDKPLEVSLAMLSVIFVTVAISLQFSGSALTLAWILESVLLFLVSLSVKRFSYYRIFGSFIYAVGLIKLFFDYIDGTDFQHFTPFLNQRFFYFLIAIICTYLIAYICNYAERGLNRDKRSQFSAVFAVVANLLTLYLLISEIELFYSQQIMVYGADAYSIGNQSNTVISILLAVYSMILIAVGFIFRNRLCRIFGLVLFFITALKVFIDVWNLGQLYGIITSIVFGIIALVGSFAYAKYKGRLKEMMGSD